MTGGPTRLIVTLRDVQEAHLLSDSGIDLEGIDVDIKEPSRGSLGRADFTTIDQILEVLPAAVRVSVAWGELSEQVPRPPARWQHRVDLFKLGLAHMTRWPAWRGRWTEEMDRLAQVAPCVAVAYADAPLCGAPELGSLLPLASRLDIPIVLIDTFHKQFGSLLTHWSSGALHEACRRIQRHGCRVAVAGSLSPDDLGLVCRMQPDWIALRGALTSGQREGRIVLDRLRRVVDLWRGEGFMVDERPSGWESRQAADSGTGW